jgi:ParB family chromosome partitioning protein
MPRSVVPPTHPDTQADPSVNVTTRKLSDIQLNSSYLRLDTDVSSLKQSIISVGLIHPLAINPDNELLAGARRFQAISELGWEEVPVQVIERDVLVQELISIDENLVRTPLTSIELEQSLNRGREIYEQLHPTANKVDLSLDEQTAEEKAMQKQREEQDKDSFAAVTAEKTGLSKAVIKSAIKRDELASDVVKKARGDGELDATKTNEIIKLDMETQVEILPLLADKTAKEARRIVAAAKEGGYEAALAEAGTVVPMPREYRQMVSPVKRVNRTLTRILVEDLHYDGPEREAIHGELVKLRETLEQYFARSEEQGQAPEDDVAEGDRPATDDPATDDPAGDEPALDEPVGEADGQEPSAGAPPVVPFGAMGQGTDDAGEDDEEGGTTEAAAW